MYRSLDLVPIPQDRLQADQLIHSDAVHVSDSVRQSNRVCYAKAAFTKCTRRSFGSDCQLLLVVTDVTTRKPTSTKCLKSKKNFKEEKH